MGGILLGSFLIWHIVLYFITAFGLPAVIISIIVSMLLGGNLIRICVIGLIVWSFYCGLEPNIIESATYYLTTITVATLFWRYKISAAVSYTAGRYMNDR